jgi:hypothetical protein
MSSGVAPCRKNEEESFLILPDQTVRSRLFFDLQPCLGHLTNPWSRKPGMKSLILVVDKKPYEKCRFSNT